MEMENKAIRVYPRGYTGNSIKDLNDLFDKGWAVKIVVPESNSDSIVYQYILERVKKG